MAYIQRTKEEILRGLLARTVARSSVTDVTEGSVLYVLLSSVAEQIANSEYQLARLRQQFTMTNSTGAELDERALELGLTRLQAVNATGTIELTRSSTGSSLTVPAGLIVSNPSNSALVYYTRNDVTFSSSDETRTVSIIAGIAGSAGNATQGAITQMQNPPDTVISCTNLQALTNGKDQETDDLFINRCRNYLLSQSRSQVIPIETFAKSFTAIDGTRALNAKVYESASIPAYSELLIDDGSGLYNTVTTTEINTTSFSVYGDQNPLIMPISKPVTENSNIVLTRTRGSFIISPTKYRILHERGVIVFLDRSDLIEGDTVSTNSYSIYTGLIDELQDQIEGNPNDPINKAGYRAIGTRVRVLPAPITLINLDIQLSAYTGVDLVALQDRLNLIATGFINSLEAGQPLFIAQLIDALMNDTDLENVKIYTYNTLNLSPDIYPTSQRHILKTDTIRLFVSTRR
jgi:hypothetical protein